MKVGQRVILINRLFNEEVGQELDIKCVNNKTISLYKSSTNTAFQLDINNIKNKFVLIEDDNK